MGLNVVRCRDLIAQLAQGSWPVASRSGCDRLALCATDNSDYDMLCAVLQLWRESIACLQPMESDGRHRAG